MKDGVVILGHGSRAAVGEANLVLLEIAEMVKRQLSLELVEMAFMNEK